VALYLNVIRTTLVIPLVLAVEAAWGRALRWRWVALLAIPMLTAAAYLAAHVPAIRTGKGSESVYYRVENYRFSLHLALKHPWFGIGLRAPRDDFLKDYELKYPFVSREQFAASVRRIRTSENIFLTFLAEVGLPFTLLYVCALVVLLRRLLRRVRAPGPAAVIPPLALLLPLTAALLHFQLLDGLFHPQISWFFHVLLGLIRPEEGERSDNGPI
jgi:O-antigen ligase